MPVRQKVKTAAVTVTVVVAVAVTVTVTVTVAVVAVVVLVVSNSNIYLLDMSNAHHMCNVTVKSQLTNVKKIKCTNTMIE